jgi:ABC-type transporter MlaC component
MSFRALTLGVALAVCGAAAALAAPADKSPALGRTEAFIAAFKQVKPGVPAEQQPKAFSQLDTFLDFETLTSEALKPRADKFSPAQRSEYQQKFRELIRLIAYPDSGDFFRRAQLKFGASKAQGDVTLVPFTASIPKEDLETEVTLHWASRPDGLRLVDVSFDGASLVRDYQNQFTKIIDKDGPQGLIRKLDERRAQLAKANAEKKAP